MRDFWVVPGSHDLVDLSTFVDPDFDADLTDWTLDAIIAAAEAVEREEG